MLFNETFAKKGLLLLTTKLTEKIPDPCNAKELYQSFMRKKNTKSLKQSKVITQQPKTFENLNPNWDKISYYRTSKYFT